MTSPAAPWWTAVLRDERRWCARLLRDGHITGRDEAFLRRQGGLSLLVSSLVVLLQPRPAWRSACRAFFVSFGQDELAHSTVRLDPELYAPLNFGPRAVFKGARLGFVLNSLYLLINFPDRKPARLRKFLLARHFAYVEKLLPQLRNCVFLVKQDYFGPSSLLVTLSWRAGLRVPGIQHGLMDTDAILRTRIYPCVRTQVEYAYNEFYKSVFTDVKPASTTVEVLGPPYDCGADRPPTRHVSRVVFISSGHLRTEEGREWIDRVRQVATEAGLTFQLRPHPSEKDAAALEPYLLEQSPLAAVFDGDPGATVFVGIFSSLLYQAAYKGFRTLWLLKGQEETPFYVALLRDLPNATALRQEQFGAGLFETLREHAPEPVAHDSVGTRLTRLLEASFPGFRQ